MGRTGTGPAWIRPEGPCERHGFGEGSSRSRWPKPQAFATTLGPAPVAPPGNPQKRMQARRPRRVARARLRGRQGVTPSAADPWRHCTRGPSHVSARLRGVKSLCPRVSAQHTSLTVGVVTLVWSEDPKALANCARNQGRPSTCSAWLGGSAAAGSHHGLTPLCRALQRCIPVRPQRGLSSLSRRKHTACAFGDWRRRQEPGGPPRCAPTEDRATVQSHLG